MSVSAAVGTPANFNTNTTSTSGASIATIPGAGDKVYVVVNLKVGTSTNGATVSGFSVSGLGATWVQKDIQQVASNGSTSGHAHVLFEGSGATSSGAITVSWTGNAFGSVTPYVVSGLTANTVAAVSNGTLSATVNYSGPSSNAQSGQLVLDVQYCAFASTTNGSLFSATNPGSGWTVQTAYQPGTNGKWRSGYRIPSETSATAHSSDLATNGFSSSGARITQWVIGDATATVPSTTLALPASAGLAMAAASVVKTTLAAAVTAGLAFSATPVVSTTLALPASAGLDFAATSFERGTTDLQLPVEAGLSFQASTVVSTTLDLPVLAGLEFAAANAAEPITTLALPVTVGMSFAASGGDAILPGWTADESGKAIVGVQPVGGPLLLLPPIAPPPPVPFVERMLTRQSHQLPSLTADANHRVHADGTHPIVVEDIGVAHLFVNGRDVTYFRDVPVLIGEWSSSLPGGDETASVEFPQTHPWEQWGTGDLDWLHPDAPAEIWLCKDGVRVGQCQFAGHLVSDNPSLTGTDMTGGWHLAGAISQADHQGHRVPIMLEPTDIGQLIAKDLNDVVSRRWATVKPVNTGILTRKRGAYRDTTLDYINELLGTAWTTTAQQWTVRRGTAPRTFQIGLKQPVDLDHVDHVVTAGAPGVEIDLTYDGEQVIDAVYGSGVGPNGYSWAGWCHPYLHPDASPPFPFDNPDAVITIGTTDADTDTGDGVSLWQDRARALGLVSVEVSGVFEADDREAAFEIQRRYGLLEDGVVGAQTWNATFAVGTNVGTLDGSYRRTLAIRPQVAQYLHAANGAVIGDNPAYDPSLIRREIDIDFGPGVTKGEAIKSALMILARNATPGWAGTITFRADPWYTDRFSIFEGDNIHVLGWRGTDTLVVQVVAVRKSPDGTVTVTVDTKARDAMTLSSILERDRDARIDPAQRPGPTNRRSRAERDMAVEFDGESGAGFIPRLALRGGLWSVIPCPVSQVGEIVKITSATSPAAKHTIVIFGAPIQPTHLDRYIGNPLASDDPFGPNGDILIDKFAFIEGFGQKDQACGYGHGKESDGGTLTGKFEDTAGFSYASTKGPWLWVAIYSPTSTFFNGRLLPAPMST